MTHQVYGDSIYTQFNHTHIILSEFDYYLSTLVSNVANYIIVILDSSLVFRVTIPDAVLILIQFDLLRMSKILLETCRGL
jgi:hypothetical protein